MLWLKAFHIIAVICWFAGLFYLPRLFVYHASSSDAISLARFHIMERKLYRGIMWPSMIATIGSGIWMLALNWGYYGSQAWMHAKLSLVVLLIIYHFMCGYYLKQFAQQKNTRSSLFFRVFNEMPVLVLIAVVILVVVRPF